MSAIIQGYRAYRTKVADNIVSRGLNRAADSWRNYRALDYPGENFTERNISRQVTKAKGADTPQDAYNTRNPRKATGTSRVEDGLRSAAKGANRIGQKANEMWREYRSSDYPGANNIQRKVNKDIIRSRENQSKK